MQEKSALADDSNEKRRDIVRLFPGATQVWVDSGPGRSPARTVVSVRFATLESAPSRRHAPIAHMVEGRYC